jgi:hypothetical protein
MNLKEIIVSLEGSKDNDNQKFALLLILSELIKTNKINDQINDQLNERLFNSIDPHFLARLIATRQVPTNCSPNAYKTVAMSILTQFLDSPNLICDPILLSKIDIICNILNDDKTITDQNEKNTNKKMIVDTFKYLFALTNHCPEVLCQNSNLLNVLIKDIILSEHFYNQIVYQQIKDYDDGDCDVNKQFDLKLNEDDIAFIASQLFVLLCDKAAHLNDDLNKTISRRIETLLEYFISEINRNQNEFKFRLLLFLNYFLEQPALTKYITRPEDEQHQQQSTLIFNILNDIFKSKLNEQWRDVSFILLNNFVKIFDFEYIYMKNRSFFYLIIHLLCIQIGMEILSPNAMCQRRLQKISIYYSLLEEIIIILSTAAPFDDEDEDEDDDYEKDFDSDDSNTDDDDYKDITTKKSPKKDKQVQRQKGDEEEKSEKELKNAIKVVVNTLETVMVFVKDNLDDESVELSGDNCMLVIASIRLLVCWMTHESLLEQELLDLMPKLIKFAQNYHSKSNEMNVFDFIIPGLQRVLIDKQDILSVKNFKLLSLDSAKNDSQKVEFEKCEVIEEIDKIEKMLTICYKNKT